MIISRLDIQVEEDCPMGPTEGNQGKKDVPLEMCSDVLHNEVPPVKYLRTKMQSNEKLLEWGLSS
jgi:hypothetical protein